MQHSFRHYVNNRLSRETSILKAGRAELIGHEGDDTNERVYIEPSPIIELKAAVDGLPMIDDLVPGEEGAGPVQLRPFHQRKLHVISPLSLVNIEHRWPYGLAGG